MEFRLSDTQRQFKDAVTGFAERHLAEDALKRAHGDEFPLDVARLLSAQGLMGITIDAEDGGQGGSLMDAVIAIETIAGVCPRSADVVQAGNFGAIRVLAEFGTDAQKEKHLSRLLAGEAVISIGMTEPEAGSAVTELKTTATPDGDGFRINGTKVFTTHSVQADLILAYVRFGPGTGGIGSVLIERGMEGLSLGNPVRYMGGDEWAQVYMEDVYIPPENVVLGPGGFKRQIAGFNVERIGNSTRSLALGQLAFDIARDHALERRQFGKPICEFQGLQWKFADMKVELDAARLLLYRAAVNADAGFPSAEETSIAKLACNRAGFNAANEALQVMGATGYSQDSIVEYCFRRTRGWMIAGGSLEMMRNRIAESIFDRRFSQRAQKPVPLK
jgi:alkylation response protein AidB-like acyl-CoA dehydrogenase